MRLLAPAGPAAALVGTGRSEVSAVLPWDSPDTASLLAGDLPAGPLASGLLEADVVVAWTRSPGLVAALRAHARQLLVHDPTPPADAGHAAGWLARPLDDLGLRPSSEPPPPLVFSSDESRAADLLAASLPARFLAVHAGSGSPAKTWPAERFAALVEELAPRRAWLLILGPAEAEGPAPLLRLPRAVPARELPLRVLAALVGRAGLCVGNDSGISHLAAAGAAPTLALFGPTDPSVWAPLGPSVECVRSPDRTMTGLEVAAVLAAADRLRRSPPR